MIQVVTTMLTALCASAFAAEFITAPDFYAQVYKSSVTPRGLFVDASGDLLYVSIDQASIFSVTEVPQEDGTIGLLEASLINGRDYGIRINHGIYHYQGYLYASSASAVYRWPYVAGSHALGPEVPAETVINNMPTPGHFTRTLEFEAGTSILYVSIGSDANVDPNSDRARIRRFNLADSVVFPIDFNTGEVFADGLRNEVGIGFDSHGILWGVENGADELNRTDLGGYEIHNTNPAEEVNRFDGPIGAHYGYPYCFSSDILEGYEPLTQFAWPDFMDDGVHDDDWCRNTNNNRRPLLALPAHGAPLDIKFYRGEGCDTVPGAFPCDFIGDAFVAMHGSWNSDWKVGYRVVHLPFTKSEPFLPTGEVREIIYDADLETCGRNCFRPVNAVFNQNGHLIVSADESDELFQVTFGVPPPPVKQT